MSPIFSREAGKRPLIYGHRGMRGAPENTLPAFALALDAGADGIELDVRTCRSGEVVVMHDPDLVRMAGVDANVADLDFRELAAIELREPPPETDASAQDKHAARASARLITSKAPLLNDVLDFALGRSAIVNVEIKSDVPDLEAVTAAVARELAARTEKERERILVSSFHPLVLLGVRAQAPDLSLAFLLGEEQYEMYAPKLTNYGEHPRASFCTQDTLVRYRTRASFINVWTVNSVERAKRLAALDIDGIITDVADRMLDAF
jgi:glycerophosphoryl diester phosphodiesterase